MLLEVEPERVRPSTAQIRDLPWVSPGLWRGVLRFLRGGRTSTSFCKVSLIFNHAAGSVLAGRPLLTIQSRHLSMVAFDSGDIPHVANPAAIFLAKLHDSHAVHAILMASSLLKEHAPVSPVKTSGNLLRRAL